MPDIGYVFKVLAIILIVDGCVWLYSYFKDKEDEN